MADKHAHLRRAHGSDCSCVETQSREIMAMLVHDVVAEAMRLGLNGPAEPAAKANGAPVRRRTNRVRNG
jgi:hypothetical protein